VDVGPEVGGNQGKDVTAITRGTIRPETSLLAFEYHLEAVAWAAQDVPDQKLAPTLLSRRKHCGQDRFHACDQFSANFVPLAVIDVAPVVLPGGDVSLKSSIGSTLVCCLLCSDPGFQFALGERKFRRGNADATPSYATLAAHGVVG
jgi:hypothetical protein